MKILKAILAAALLCGGALQLQAGQDAATKTVTKDKATDEKVIAMQLPSYPLTTCVVSGEGLEEPKDFVVEGRLVRTCCGMCAKKVKADPAASIAKIDAAVIKQQSKMYPLDTCPVSGEKLGSMGDPIDIVSGTRLVKVCCKGCIKSVKKDPSASLAKVDAALIEAQRPTYPTKVCLVSTEELGSNGEPVEFLYGTQLVRLCCKGCVKGFKKDPAKYVAELKADKKKMKQG